MKALFGMAEAVPLSRVARDYRLWLVALVIGLAVNIAALTVFVLPLSAIADATAARAARAADRSSASARARYSSRCERATTSAAASAHASSLRANDAASIAPSKSPAL